MMEVLGVLTLLGAVAYGVWVWALKPARDWLDERDRLSREWPESSRRMWAQIQAIRDNHEGDDHRGNHV